MRDNAQYMTLDEAIAKYKQRINRLKALENELVDEARQLFALLNELKNLRAFRDKALAILPDEEVAILLDEEVDE